jgi:hypothetical protein
LQSGIRHPRCLTKIRLPMASWYIEYVSPHILKVYKKYIELHG